MTTREWIDRQDERELQRLAVRAAAILEQRKRVASNFCPHEPTPRQAQFLALDCQEALYGGAAGGGKSDAMLMSAAKYVHVPGYAALLFRRTYADLSKDDAIMTRAREWWIPQGVRWDAKDKRFTFPSGATIAFGYLDCDNDRYNYQGGAWQFIGFDELTQFPEAWYTYLLSRLRRATGVSVPLRARGASNPGGVGHDWVFKRFVDPSTRLGEFVPAALVDNPHLDQVAYRASLSLVDPTLRRQLEEGLWIRDGSGLVYAHFDEARNGVASAPPIKTHALGLDFGVNDENALTVLGWRPNDPTVYVLRSYRKKGLVSAVAEEVLALDEQFHFDFVVGDTGGMGKLFAEELAARYGIVVHPADKSNKQGFISLMNADLGNGRIKVLLDECKDLVGEWVSLPWGPSLLKEDPKFLNHAADSALYVWRASLAYHERPAPVMPAQGTAAFNKMTDDEMERLAVEIVDREGAGDVW